MFEFSILSVPLLFPLPFLNDLLAQVVLLIRQVRSIFHFLIVNVREVLNTSGVERRAQAGVTDSEVLAPRRQCVTRAFGSKRRITSQLPGISVSVFAASLTMPFGMTDRIIIGTRAERSQRSRLAHRPCSPSWGGYSSKQNKTGQAIPFPHFQDTFQLYFKEAKIRSTKSGNFVASITQQRNDTGHLVVNGFRLHDMLSSRNLKYLEAVVRGEAYDRVVVEIELLQCSLQPSKLLVDPGDRSIV